MPDGTVIPTEIKPPIETPKPTSVKVEAPVAPSNKEISPQKEVNDALEQAGKYFLDHKDERVAIAALTRAAGENTEPTPIGQQLRQEFIAQLQKDEKLMEIPEMASIKNLTNSEKLETNAIQDFFDKNKAHFPAEARTQMDEMLFSGRYSTAELAQNMQSHINIKIPLQNALLGENHPPMDTKSDALQILKITPDNKNIQKWDQAFEQKQPFKDKLKMLGGKTLMVGFYGFLLMQIGQALSAESRQNH